MAAYIDLFADQRRLGRFDLPQEVMGERGQRFRLTYAAFSGGNGIVFEGRRLTETGGIDRVCAIKLLRQQDLVRTDRFQNEIRILKALRHPYITPFYDSGTIELDSGERILRVPWMAMDLGHHNLRYHVENSGPLSLDETLRVSKQLCEALTYFHDQGMVHRDLKPANVVWTSEARTSIQLIDFGIAKYIGEDVSGRPLDDFTRTLEFVGPVFFSSPELIAYANDKTVEVDRRSDIFQLGKLMWFIATGKISAGVPNRRNCPAGGALRDLVVELIDDDPDNRPQSVRQVMDLLERLHR